MARVRPFRGIRYNPSVVEDLGKVVCPPFDTIQPQLQRSLYHYSPHNVVRLEAGEQLPDDTAENSRYTRAGALLGRWLAEGVLQRDDSPAFYLVEHTFQVDGRAQARTELIASVHLEDYDNRIVLPHEFTRDGDKQDRLALMEACRTNLSPIMCLYLDPAREIHGLLQNIKNASPLAKLSDIGHQEYLVWKVDNEDPIGRIKESMSDKALYIADGHHRYETALTYRDLQRKAAGGSLPEDVACNNVMMGLVGFDDPGLMVLPYHRILKEADASSLAQIRYELWKYFNPMPETDQSLGDLGALLARVDELGKSRLTMGMLDPGGRGTQILGLRPGVDLGNWGVISQSEPWILEELILRPILGDKLSRCIDYVHDAADAETGIKNGELQMAFLQKPFPLDLFREIMDLGQKLPPKSTFFYPKLPTGLVLNPLEGSI